MGGVVGELLLPVEGLLQPGEHGVEFGGQRVNFVLAAGQSDAAGKIIPRADLPGGLGDLPHRGKGPPGEQIPAHRRQHHKDRQHQQRRPPQSTQGGFQRVGRRDAAHPHGAVVLHLDLLVVEIPLPLAAFHRAQRGVGKHHRVVEIPGHKAVEGHPRRVVQREIHPVVEGFQVPVNVQLAVLHFQVAAAVLGHGLHAVQRGLPGRLRPCVEQKSQRKPRSSTMKRVVKQRDPQGNGKTLHTSSRRT